MHGSVEELEGYYANEDLTSSLLKNVSKDENEWSQIPGMPSFDKSTWNGVAVVPLLTSNYLGKDSHRSFESLLGAFKRYADNVAKSGSAELSMSPAVRRRSSLDENKEGDSEGSDDEREVVWREDSDVCKLVLANNQLTRPGDWKYDSTPLRCFDWNNGCQRINVFDGRPEKSRMAYDRVVNKAVGASWADLIPSRRTAAVVGVLNCRDCLSDPDLLRQAENELHAWASLYSVPWYEVTAAFQGRSEPIPMDPHTAVLQRMFVFDSFDEDSQRCLNLSASPLGSSLVAFPPCDDMHTHMMDLHLNVVINDLAVAIFRNLEDQIRLCDSQAKAFGGISPHYARLSNSSEVPTDIGSIVANTPSAVNVGKDGAASENDDKPFGGKFKAAMATASTAVNRLRGPVSHAPPKPRFLYTPIDQIVDVASLTPRDADAIKKRDVARREKYTADLSLLAGSPLDALSRYSHSADLTKGHDPLWYAFSQLGCVEAFIAMADMGGHGVDAYLENNFQYPEDIMTILLNKAQQANNADTSNAYLEKKYMDRFKTTLPNVVYNKTDEVLSILCKHPQLLPHYVQLLLKLARYISDIEDNHLQCLWGHGTTCYSGDAMSMGPPRWKRIPSDLGQITSADLKNTPNKRDYNTLASFSKIQRCSDLFHKAISISDLDARTRADVATTCARLCIAGIKATTWGQDHALRVNSSKPFDRFPLLRKAAFFTTVAAQSMLQCSSLHDVTQRSASLWLAANNMYSRKGNSCMDYGNYAWATLRATMLHALSLQADPIVAEPAAELFMVLLSELSPDNAMKLNMLKHARKSEDDNTVPGAYSVDYDDDDSVTESVSELSISSKKYANALTAKKQQANTATNITARSAFFNAIAPSAWSTAQSKWMENDPIPNINLPLVDPKDLMSMDHSNGTLSAANFEENLISQGLHASQYLSSNENPDFLIANNLISINAVVPQIKFDACAKIQSVNLIHLLQLRRDLLPTLSSFASATYGSNFQPSFCVYNDVSPPIPPPIQVTSANVVKSESHLLLDRCKAHALSGKPGAISSMATFFNPYASKKTEDGNKTQSTLVAQGEERYMLIVFENFLNIPLDIPSCQLEFDVGSKDSDATTHSIEVPPLSFTIPAKSKNFSVRFPFIVLALSSHDVGVAEVSNDDGKQYEKISDILDLVGLRVTCLNRSFLLSFGLGNSLNDMQEQQLLSRRNIATANGTMNNSNSTSQLPSSGYLYLRSPHSIKKTKIKDEQLSVRIETVPPQPNLLVSFTTSQTPLEDSAVVPVHLSDGEIYTIPPFRLENDCGASGLGRMERLQIVGVGLPGLPDEILFDTDLDAEALARSKKDDMFDLGDSDDEGSESSDFQELMEIEDGKPPLRMKAIINALSLKSINDPKQVKQSNIKGNVVTFQIAGMHDMGNSLANGGHVRIRFRYRGPSPNPATEIWRKREVNLRIVRVKGPRISSLSFRSDLSWGSAFTELSRALSQQKLRLGNIPKWGPGNLAKRKMASCNFSAAAQRRHMSGADGNGHKQLSSNESQYQMMDNSMNNSVNLNDESSILHDGDVDDSQSFVLTRVGRDAGVHVSADEIVVLMAVANETNSTIVLSNRKGRVGGFEGSPMPTVRVTSGVSVKIPVVIQRIERLDEEGQVVDIAAELISRTALQWESAVAETSPGDSTTNASGPNSNLEKVESGSLALTSSSTSKARHGRVRIPSRCLREIIEEHKSFASRICKAPIHIRFDIGVSSSDKKLRNSGEMGKIQVSPGVFIDTKVDVTMQDWVPNKVISNISFTLEFCCAKKDSESTNQVQNILLNFDNGKAYSNPYIWTGQLRRCIRGIKTRDEVMTHTARIAFIERGTYVVSACVKISMFGVNGNEETLNYIGGKSASTSGEEVWWAPRAETVLVIKEN